MRISAAISPQIPQSIRWVLSEIVSKAQGKQHDVLTSTPTVNTVPELGITFYYDGSDLYLYTKYKGTLYRVGLTAV